MEIRDAEELWHDPNCACGNAWKYATYEVLKVLVLKILMLFGCATWVVSLRCRRATICLAGYPNNIHVHKSRRVQRVSFLGVMAALMRPGRHSDSGRRIAGDPRSRRRCCWSSELCLWSPVRNHTLCDQHNVCITLFWFVLSVARCCAHARCVCTPRGVSSVHHIWSVHQAQPAQLRGQQHVPDQ
jgi:hypothetical protein